MALLAVCLPPFLEERGFGVDSDVKGKQDYVGAILGGKHLRLAKKLLGEGLTPVR